MTALLESIQVRPFVPTAGPSCAACPHLAFEFRPPKGDDTGGLRHRVGPPYFSRVSVGFNDSSPVSCRVKDSIAS